MPSSVRRFSTRRSWRCSRAAAIDWCWCRATPGGNAAGAANAARAVIGEGARLILGPLLAPEVEAVKPIAHDAHLNVIAFSTVTNLAGGNVFLMGFLPRQEVVREVGYARERGLDPFCGARAQLALRSLDGGRTAGSRVGDRRHA